MTPQTGNAQMMFQSSPSANQNNISQTKQDEQAGQNIYNDLTSNKTTCNKLTNDDFEKLGEYFMGQSIGDTQRHTAVNQMIINMMGEGGEGQMHITMGKRLSGCDPNAQIPTGGNNFISMFSNQGGGGNSMMWWGFGPMSGWGGAGFGVFMFIAMFLFWVLLIVGAIALIRYLMSPRREDKVYPPTETSLQILQERYVRGEIDKKEFEEKKKDLI